MILCCKCTCNTNCYGTTLYLPGENFCDGTDVLGNAIKPADCPDRTDEIFKTCCAGEYSAYDTSICSKF